MVNRYIMAKIQSQLILKGIEVHKRTALVLRTDVKIIVGENDEADIRTTIMDPNTRMLIKVNITDIENDMKTFQLLRGNSPQDAQGRRMMMHEYKIPKELIDT